MHKRGTVSRAVTLIELLVVFAVIAVLALLLLQAFNSFVARAERVHCTDNLRNLQIAAELYVQDKNQWPQIRLSGLDENALTTYAQQWIAALLPYKVPQKTWICPTIEKLLGNPDYMRSGNERVDYIAMPFDNKPTTPHQWPRQPWFVEKFDVHGNGNLILFTDGSISDLKTVAPTPK